MDNRSGTRWERGIPTLAGRSNDKYCSKPRNSPAFWHIHPSELSPRFPLRKSAFKGQTFRGIQQGCQVPGRPAKIFSRRQNSCESRVSLGKQSLLMRQPFLTHRAGHVALRLGGLFDRLQFGASQTARGWTNHCFLADRPKRSGLVSATTPLQLMRVWN